MGKIVKRYDWYRPCFVECKDKIDDYQITDIIIYNEDGIITRTGQGYFDNNEILEFKDEVIFRAKQNFTRKENFIVRHKRDTILNETLYDLYIYVDNVDLVFTGYIKKYNNVYKRYTINNIEFLEYVKSLEKDLWVIKGQFEEEMKKLVTYKLPYEEIELDEICENLKRINKEIRNEIKRIADYIPSEKDEKN